MIKSMLNLNVSEPNVVSTVIVTKHDQPSMRPSAAQLLQNERVEFTHKVFETQKQ